MTHLHVKVTEKTAYYTGPMPVCGNSDYMVEWELDQEWDDRQSKTMRVVFPDGRYQDTDATMMTSRRSKSAIVAEWRRRSISSLRDESFSI